MSFLNKYIKKYWGPFTLAILILAAEAACDLIMPTVMAQLIDQGVVHHQMDVIQSKGVFLLGLTIAGAIAAALRNIISSHVSQRTGSELRFDVYSKIQAMEFKQLNAFDSGSLMTRLTNDVNLVQQFIHGIMRVFVKAPMIFMGSLIMVITLSGSLATVLGILLPLVVLSIFMNMRIGYPFFMKMQSAIDRLNGAFREYLAGVRVVKAFNRFDYEDHRFQRHNDHLSQTATRAMRIMAVFSPLNALILNLGIAVLLWLGGQLVLKGQFEVGKVMAIVNYMLQIIMSLGLITMIFNLLIRTRASLERLREIFDIDTRPMEADTDLAMDGTAFKDEIDFSKQNLTFKNVYFKYDVDAESDVLTNISFELKPGEVLGVIGATGSGKSALIALIAKFYNPDSGQIFIGKHTYDQIDAKTLRSQMGIVLQKNFLFSGTILENLKWGDDCATEETLWKCLAIASADVFVNTFEHGIHTVLGQGGVNLSGGQKQRLAIARALVKTPKIILLDDATSAVDITTERAIREGFEAYLKGLSTVIVAQRISSVKNAHRILVLDEGRQVGYGTHLELMQSCDVYRDIYESQMGTSEVIA